MLTAALRNHRKPVSNLDAFNSIDAHHRGGNIRIEPTKNWLAEANRQPLSDDINPSADRISSFTQQVYLSFERLYLTWLGTKERVLINKIEIFGGQHQVTHLS